MPTGLPPGPPLPGPLQTVLMMWLPGPFLTRCQHRYGDVFSLRVPIPGLDLPGPVVYLADPDAIQELFAVDGLASHAGLANAVLAPATGPNSILLLDGEDHLQERRLLTPAFHGAAIRRLETTVREATLAELETWSHDKAFALRPAMQRITFDVIVRAVFSVDDPTLRRRLLGVFEPVFDISPPALSPAFRIDLWGLSPWGRFRRAVDRLDNTLFELIEQRRGEEAREDILGLLLASADANGDPLSVWHIRDELVTLLLAGHETTATALSWALELLAHHPEVTARAREDLAKGEDAYVDAIGLETLRVRPVVLSVARELTEPVEVAGFRLPAGTTAVPAINLVHFDERNFGDAGEFRPERFAERAPSRRLWLPFGGGRRRCLGASLAQMELRVVLSEVLAQFVPAATRPTPENARRRGITFAPEHGARLRMRRLPLVREAAAPSPA